MTSIESPKELGTECPTDIGSSGFELKDNQYSDQYIFLSKCCYLMVQAFLRQNNALFDIFKPQLNGITAFQQVTVSLWLNGQRCANASGEGSTCFEQLSSAVARACLDTRFRKLIAGDAPHLSTNLWLQTSREDIPAARREKERTLVDGLHGIEVQWDDAFGCSDPSAFWFLESKSPAALLASACKEAGLFEDAWRDNACKISTTIGVHLCHTPRNENVVLVGLRREANVPLSAVLIRQWIDESVHYLARSQIPDGSFTYLYSPLTDSVAQNRSNTVRNSGCAYAMAHAVGSCSAKLTEIALNSAESSIRGILSRCVIGANECLIVPEHEAGSSGKLGSLALLTAATLAPVLADRFQPWSEQLINSLLAAQNSDGMFTCYLESDQPDGNAINYFPGEALLALTMSSGRGDSCCLKACERAFEPYRDHFRSQPSTAFVGWQADVWSRMARLCKKRHYAEFVFEQLDWILSFQQKDSSNMHEYGGFRVGGHINISTAVYAEALIRGANLARSLANEKLWSIYRDAALAAVNYCARLRLQPEQAPYFPNPERAIGGVTGSLSHFEVRADHVQHTLTMAIAALESGIVCNA